MNPLLFLISPHHIFISAPKKSSKLTEVEKLHECIPLDQEDICWEGPVCRSSLLIDFLPEVSKKISPAFRGSKPAASPAAIARQTGGKNVAGLWSSKRRLLNNFQTLRRKIYKTKKSASLYHATRANRGPFFIGRHNKCPLAKSVRSQNSKNFMNPFSGDRCSRAHAPLQVHGSPFCLPVL